MNNYKIQPNPEWIGWHSKSTNEKNKIYNSMNLEERRNFSNWLREDNYRQKELFAIKNHNQACNCLHCRVYRSRLRKRTNKVIRRYPRPK